MALKGLDLEHQKQEMDQLKQQEDSAEAGREVQVWCLLASAAA